MALLGAMNPHDRETKFERKFKKSWEREQLRQG